MISPTTNIGNMKSFLFIGGAKIIMKGIRENDFDMRLDNDLTLLALIRVRHANLCAFFCLKTNYIIRPFFLCVFFNEMQISIRKISIAIT